jgi:hypothetical protein
VDLLILQIEAADVVGQSAAMTVLKAIPELQLLLKDIGGSSRDGCCSVFCDDASEVRFFRGSALARQACSSDAKGALRWLQVPAQGQA